MTFSESIRTVLMRKYADFDGRASRSEYWWFILFQFLVHFIIIGLGMAFGDAASESASVGDATVMVSGLGNTTIILLSITWFALLIPSLAVGWRRFHDRNMSGLWYLVFFIIFPPVAWVICMLAGSPESNQYGAPPVLNA